MAESEQREHNDLDLQGTMNILAPSEPHFAIVLLLDTSLSMSGDSINSLNKAINSFREHMILDDCLKEKVDVCIIEFNENVRVVQEFTPISQLEPVNLTTFGGTSMGAGINLAIDKVKERARLYTCCGTPRYRPWIFMITDGCPTDDITDARERIIAEEQKKRVEFWAVGVPGYDRAAITKLTQRCIEMSGAENEFEVVFNCLSNNIGSIVCTVNKSVIWDAPLKLLPLPKEW